MNLAFHNGTRLAPSWAQCLARAAIPPTSANRSSTNFPADTTPSRARVVVPIAYVGASGPTTQRTTLTEQFHLSRLQVINWGVFDGYHSIPFSSGGALTAGASGSARSSSSG